MRHSMTGYASGQGEMGTWRWTWDLRGVNGKGLDLRLRVPDWIEGLEAGLRASVTRAIGRGNVSVALRVHDTAGEGALTLSEAQLSNVLAAMTRIEEVAMAQGLSLAPATSAQIVALRGVMDSASSDSDTTALRDILLTDFGPVLSGFVDMRAHEGRALDVILTDQLSQIEALTAEAAKLVEDRRDEQGEKLRAALARVMDNTDGADPQRVAQELAMIAVKADVTEELDRLRAHINAARDLLATTGAVGRKLDFLMQEFNREANTLCSKAQSSPLTQVGLTLKTVIDQMREQVQNLE